MVILLATWYRVQLDVQINDLANTAWLRQRENRVHIGGLSVEMHREDRRDARPRCVADLSALPGALLLQHPSEGGRVHGPGRRIDVHEDRIGESERKHGSVFAGCTRSSFAGAQVQSVVRTLETHLAAAHQERTVRNPVSAVMPRPQESLHE